MPMQSRTDQVHSYEFFLQRIVSGLVARESDPAELPFRRLGWSGFGSIMVTIVVAGIFAIVGLLVGGGNDSWRDGDKIIVEKGHETIYVYFPDRDRLHPAANMVSAQLMRPGGDVVRVSSRSLEGVPRGETLGIVGAPNLPPDSDDLLTGPWTLCSQQQDTGTGRFDTISVLGVGKPPDGGQPVGDQAVLVNDVDRETLHMVWRGHRYEIESDVEEVESAVLAALDVSADVAVPVSPAWVDALPEGESLGPPPGDEPGQPSTVLPGRDLRTGQVIQDGSRYYLVRLNGLDTITELQARIVGRLSRAQPVAEQVPLDVEPRPLPDYRDASMPREAVPSFVPTDVLDREVCSVYPQGEFTPTVLAGGRLEPSTEGNQTPEVSRVQGVLADHVVIEGGKAVLVQSLSAPGAANGPWHIVNEQGIRCSLPSGDLAGAFGYGADQRVQMSGGLVALLPEGPVLDPTAADNPVVVAAPEDQSG